MIITLQTFSKGHFSIILLDLKLFQYDQYINCFSTILTSVDCHPEVEYQVPHSERRMAVEQELVVRVESWAVDQELTHPSDSLGWPVGPREMHDAHESPSCCSRLTAFGLGCINPRRLSLRVI
jgi:hypothetical protein